MNQRRLALAVISFILIDVAVYVVALLYTDYLWFESLGFGGVFLTMLEYRIAMFLLVFSVTIAILTANSFLVRRGIEDFLGEPIRYHHSVDILLALAIAWIFSDYWMSLVYFVNGVRFGLKDPIFGKDVSFYVFKLPFLKLILSVIALSIIVSFVISLLYYAYVFRWVKTFEELKDLFPQAGYTHLAILSAFSFLLISAYLLVARFDLLTSQHGVVSGASWTEVNVLMPAMLLTSLLAIVFSVISVYIGRRGFESLISIFAVFLAIAVVLLGVIPFAVQKVRVEPNELQMEWKYIGYSIEYTKFAYGLNNVERKRYEVYENLTLEKIEKNRGTIENIRLWDHRPLKEVYRQIQQIRPYYVIHDVDVDRYTIDGKYTEVMISARELSTDLLPAIAKTWVNTHLIYTHGYGVVASPVNAVSKEGLPVLVVSDIPPKGKIRIVQPRIYYGELTNDYVIVDTKQKEFDYPLGEKNVFTTYTGRGGVRLDSYIKKLLFSIRFGDVNIILSKYITSDSRILMHRNIVDRVKTLAPFLKYDDDPYIAVINGRLYWIIDAYTTLENFPYSAVYGTKFGRINYIRNPVKVFVDAYNGTVEFYIVQDEPVIKTIERVFPIFKRGMDDAKRRHIRYPINLFEIQSEVYAVYHMDNVETFYNREDVWDIPQELYEGARIRMEPYYVILSLNGNPEFVLMLPFTPKGRENMIAWMCARCDGRHYGELLLYEFPKGKLIYGPMQIEARIDQNPVISKLFTLWGQVGSRVIRGNLLVIPIERSIIYVEPVYLKAEEAQIPELRGVIVAYNDQLVMKPTLDEALKALFGVYEKRKIEINESIGRIVRECVETYKNAMNCVKSGNWSGFGEMIERLGRLLERLNESVK